MKRKPPTTAWKPGQSGNPAGMKPGTRHRATLLAQALIDADAEKVARKVIDAALAGDLAAARLVLERIVPPAKERPIALTLPGDVSTAEGVNQATGAVLNAACAGELLPGEAQAIAGILETRRRTIETVELEARVAALEGMKK